jgi:hypothetical protein
MSVLWIMQWVLCGDAVSVLWDRVSYNEGWCTDGGVQWLKQWVSIV